MPQAHLLTQQQFVVHSLEEGATRTQFRSRALTMLLQLILIDLFKGCEQLAVVGNYQLEGLKSRGTVVGWIGTSRTPLEERTLFPPTPPQKNHSEKDLN